MKVFNPVKVVVFSFVNCWVRVHYVNCVKLATVRLCNVQPCSTTMAKPTDVFFMLDNPTSLDQCSKIQYFGHGIYLRRSSIMCQRSSEKLQGRINTHFYAFNCAIVHQPWDYINRKISWITQIKYFSAPKLEAKILVKNISAERQIV